MPLILGQQIASESYELFYQQKNDSIYVSAPNKDDAKELFEWLGDKTGLIPTP